jgi:23S rRNA (cytosine1962-C5)-methyltransferase
MADTEAPANLPALRLKRNEDRRLHAGHLWIFSNEVDTQQTPLTKFKAGELVRVLAHNDRALGLAYVNPQSLISARLLETWRVPDMAWLAAAFAPRYACASVCTQSPIIVWCTASPTVCRGLVSTATGLPAWCRSGPPGMERLKPQIQEALIQCSALRGAALQE